MENLFTIIVPTYNRAATLVKALDSIKGQTYRPIEIILVDDGSTDNTEQILVEWIEQNGEPQELTVRYVCQINAGVAAARNTGVRQSNGSYVLFLDSDDMLYSQCLQLIVSAFLEQKSDLVLTGYNVFDDKTGETIDNVFGIDGEGQLEHVIRGNIHPVTMRAAFTNALVERVGFWNETMKMGEDTEYIQRALCLASKPFGIAAVLSGLRRGRNDHRHFDYNHDCRVECHEKFLAGVLAKPEVSNELKSFHVEKVMKLSFQMRLIDRPDLAKRCASSVKNTGVRHPMARQLKIFLCGMGPVGSKIYHSLYRLRVALNKH